MEACIRIQSINLFLYIIGLTLIRTLAFILTPATIKNVIYDFRKQIYIFRMALLIIDIGKQIARIQLLL